MAFKSGVWKFHQKSQFSRFTFESYKSSHGFKTVADSVILCFLAIKHEKTVQKAENSKFFYFVLQNILPKFKLLFVHLMLVYCFYDWFTLSATVLSPCDYFYDSTVNFENCDFWWNFQTSDLKPFRALNFFNNFYYKVYHLRNFLR